MKRSTLFAVVVLAVLLSAFFLTREDEVSVGVRKFTPVVPAKDAITEINVSGKYSAKLSKKNDTWFVAIGDKQYPADAKQVEGALDELTQFSTTNFVTEQPSMHEAYELTDDAATTVAFIAGGKATAMSFGKSGMGGMFVRAPDKNEVFVTKSRLPWLIRKEAKAWRDRKINNLNATNFTRMSVQNADSGLAFTRADEKWSLSEPEPPKNFRFDSSAANRAAQQFATLTAQDFLDAPPSDAALGLETPSLTVNATTDAGDTTVQFGRPANTEIGTHISALRSQFDSISALIEADEKISIAELQKASRDRALTKEVKTAATDISNADVFKRVDAGWYAGENPDGFISREDIDAAQQTVNLVPARVSGKAQVFLVPDYAYSNLNKKLDNFRDLRLADFDVSLAKKLTLTSKGKKTILEKQAGEWQLRAPKKLPDGLELDLGAVPSRLSTIRNLRASRFVPGVSAASGGINNPSLTVEVELEDGKRQRIAFGRRLTSPNGGEEVYVQGAVDSLIYAAGAHVKRPFEKGPEWFKKAPPPAANPNFQNLPPEIRKQLEAQLRQRGGM